MARKPRCAQCGSRKWYKDRSSGTVACEEGHVLIEHRNELNERTEFGTFTVHKRTIKKNKPKKQKITANPILYHGERARYHYFQCLQMVLRLQIKALSKLWSLPDEIEMICRDCWAIHLSLLRVPPDPEPYLHFQEQSGFTGQQKANGEDANSSGGEGNDESREEDSDKDGDDKSSDSTSSERDYEDDPEWNKLTEEMEAIPSSDDEDESEPHKRPPVDDNDEVGQEKKWKKKRSRPKHVRKVAWSQDDTPAGTVAVLVFACWTLRMPVIYQDFVRLIETYELPYLDPVRLLNPSMTRHLTKHAKQALSPHFAPAPVLLHTLASRLARGAFQRYGIFTPELNAAPVLWRAVRHMGGNSTLYTLTKTLARYLELPLTLSSVLAPTSTNLRNVYVATPGRSRGRASRSQSRDSSTGGSQEGGRRVGFRGRGGHKNDNVPPEAALVAVCVIALKLCYGLDFDLDLLESGEGGREVGPTGASDPLCNMPRVDAYLRALGGATSVVDSGFLNFRTREARGQAFETSAQRGGGEEKNIDAYLEFCERALLGRDQGKNRERDETVMEEMFGLEGERKEESEESSGESGIEREENVLPAVRLSRNAKQGGRSPSPGARDMPKSDAERNVAKDAARPGEAYRVFDGDDVLGRLPDAYGMVLGRAAGWCGLSEDELGAVVEGYERRLGRLFARQRRRER